ncbi:hypothetical protein AB0M43_36270 [Longispora sp. NPDC051575]|uniref:hypothetical protein n=1 Tax=Longispora sp. NPDC051575 TaxID=3154943 RepID=UPI0034397F22
MTSTVAPRALRTADQLTDQAARWFHGPAAILAEVRVHAGGQMATSPLCADPATATAHALTALATSTPAGPDGQPSTAAWSVELSTHTAHACPSGSGHGGVVATVDLHAQHPAPAALLEAVERAWQALPPPTTSTDLESPCTPKLPAP